MVLKFGEKGYLEQKVDVLGTERNFFYFLWQIIPYPMKSETERMEQGKSSDLLKKLSSWKETYCSLTCTTSHHPLDLLWLGQC